jgi:hypothetical protein
MPPATIAVEVEQAEDEPCERNCAQEAMDAVSTIESCMSELRLNDIKNLRRRINQIMSQLNESIDMRSGVGRRMRRS